MLFAKHSQTSSVSVSPIVTYSNVQPPALTNIAMTKMRISIAGEVVGGERGRAGGDRAIAGYFPVCNISASSNQIIKSFVSTPHNYGG